jgi:hypothetical protein
LTCPPTQPVSSAWRPASSDEMGCRCSCAAATGSSRGTALKGGGGTSGGPAAGPAGAADAAPGDLLLP